MQPAKSKHCRFRQLQGAWDENTAPIPDGSLIALFRLSGIAPDINGGNSNHLLESYPYAGD